MTLPNKLTPQENEALLKRLALILDALSQYTTDYVDGYIEFCVNDMIKLMEEKGYM